MPGEQKGEGLEEYKHIPSVHAVNDFHGPSSIVVFTYKDSSSGFIRDIEGVDFAETFEQGAHETEIEVFLVASDIEFPPGNAKEWNFVPPCGHLSSAQFCHDAMIWDNRSGKVERAGERVCGGHFEKSDDGDELSVETTGCKEVLVTDMTETT